MFHGHDDYVTVGENIGQTDCAILPCGLNWIMTAQPVVLGHWPATEIMGERFTSVGAWRGPYGSVEYHDKSYGLRAHEFRKFMELPRLSGQPFEVALDIHAAEVNDLALLHQNDWTLIDPKTVAADPWVYRSFLQQSRAEFMVAKNMYVQSNSGWFSDRSICYLASGKPVLAQDTGLQKIYPVGKGLLTFSTLEQAVLGVAEIVNNYPRHVRAARVGRGILRFG